MKFKFIILILLCLIVTALIMINGNTSLFQNNQNDITIGVIAPLSGELGMYGNSMKAALELSSKQINNKINNKNIKFIFEDGKCDGKTSAEVANKLINIDNVDFILSGCSSESLSIAPIAEQNKKIHISVCASSP